MDLSKLSLEEMRALREQLVQEMKRREQEEITKARDQIIAIAHSVGLPLKDLLSQKPRTANLPAAGKVAGRKVAVRYRHPDNSSLQWTGRGRQPQWIKDWLTSGQDLDALRV